MGCYILQDYERLMLKSPTSLSWKITVNITSLLFLVNFFNVFLNAITGEITWRHFYPQDFYFYIWVSAYREANRFKVRIALKLVAVSFLPCCFLCNCSRASRNPAPVLEMFIVLFIHFNKVGRTLKSQYLFMIRAWWQQGQPLSLSEPSFSHLKILMRTLM